MISRRIVRIRPAVAERILWESLVFASELLILIVLCIFCCLKTESILIAVPLNINI